MDVLRENIGLLQLPYEDEYYYDEETINEFTLPFRKKSKWQRFKDMVKRNKGKIAAAGALGAGALGGDYLLYRYGKNRAIDAAKKTPGATYDAKTNRIVGNDGSVSMRYRPFGLGDEVILRDKDNNILEKSPISRKKMIKDLFTS